MTIERLHFEGGIPFEFTQRDPQAWAIDTIIRNIKRAEVLPEGEYDLTPASWTKNTHKHNLLVYADGTATYRAIPKDREVGFLEPGTREFIPGGRIQLMPEDVGMVMVSGPSKDLKGIAVHEIIFHLPGPSPRRVFSGR